MTTITTENINGTAATVVDNSSAIIDNSTSKQRDSDMTTTNGNTSYPELLDSPTESVIAGDFGAMSAAEQEHQRKLWKDELEKTDEEIATLKQVLVSKEAHAHGLKRRLGITAWREFSEDMTHGLKHIQDSNAFKKTAQVANVAREKTAGVLASVTNSNSFQSMTDRMGSVFGAAKSKISSSMSHQSFQSYVHPNSADASKSTSSDASNEKNTIHEGVEPKA